MAKVAIVTDSTANIPDALLAQYQIHSVPQMVIWDGISYRDGIDIQPAEFYSRLANSKTMPTSSQVSPLTFKTIFSELIEQGYHVLCIVISSDLSGTLLSAIQAKEMLPNMPIELVDSRSTAMAMGFQILSAARAAEAGASLQECRAITEDAMARTGVMFVVDTLEFLHRGGRIGGASRFLGTALGLKPILEIQQGKIAAVERVRTQAKAFERLIQLVGQRINGSDKVSISTLHANAPQQALQVMKLATDAFHPIETLSTEVSPVIGTHTGPGTIGICYMVE